MNGRLDIALAEQLRPLAESAPMPPDVLTVPDDWVRGTRALPIVTRFVAFGAVTAGAAAVTMLALSFLGLLRSVDVGSLPPPTATATATASGVAVNQEQVSTTVMPGGRGLRVEGSVDGRSFDIRATADEEGLCLHVAIVVDQGTACGALPGEGLGGEAFGLAMTELGAPQVHAVAGVVATGTSSVVVETQGGMAEASLVDLAPAGFDAKLFYVFLPPGVDADAWVALS